MKRLMPTGLITFLQANPNCLKADLFVISLPNGQTLYATEGQFDITVPSGTPGWTAGTTTFLSSEFGKWNRGAITSEASFDLSTEGMSLTCVAQQNTQFPGLSMGILAAARNGLFDACQITVLTAYMPSGQYGNVSNGLETKFFGFIEKNPKINRLMVTFACQDCNYLLNQKVPSRIIQPGCQWGFCDKNCALNPSDYTVTFTAGGGSTTSLLAPQTAFTQAAGYFTQGVVTCTSGANAGLLGTVKLHDASGNLELILPFLLPVSFGDGFSVIKGCDKTAAMCGNTILPGGSSVNNLVHFSGAIAVPPPSNAI